MRPYGARIPMGFHSQGFTLGYFRSLPPGVVDRLTFTKVDRLTFTNWFGFLVSHPSAKNADGWGTQILYKGRDYCF
jgi:hypothetical protein